MKIIDTVNVYLADSSETVEVQITAWNNHHGQGEGVLANGMEVDVFGSHEGYLQLSDQHTALYQAHQEFEQVPSYVERFRDGREPVE